MHEKGISRMGIVVDLLFCIATLLYANDATGLAHDVAFVMSGLWFATAAVGVLLSLFLGSKP